MLCEKNPPLTKRWIMPAFIASHLQYIIDTVSGTTEVLLSLYCEFVLNLCVFNLIGRSQNRLARRQIVRENIADLIHYFNWEFQPFRHSLHVQTSLLLNNFSIFIRSFVLNATKLNRELREYTSKIIECYRQNHFVILILN